MTNEDLKRFYPNNKDLEEAHDFVRLDETGKIPASNLPQYVDDVVEGYYYNSKFYENETHTKEITGKTGILYVDLPTDDLYRFGGTAFVKVTDKGRGIVVDIGNGQYQPENDVNIYPTLNVDIAKTIYVNDKIAIFQILKWSLIEESNLRVLMSDKQENDYYIILYVNNHFIKFSWDNTTEGTINPEILS